MAELRRVYIDSCCFIDMVKIEVGRPISTEKESDVWHLKRLLEAHRDGELLIFTSTLTIAECTHAGDGDIRDAVKSAFSRLLTSGQYVRLVQATPFIAQDARDLRWNSGINLKGADAIHVASALEMKCEELLSCDAALERKSRFSSELSRRGLYIKTAANTACLPAKYRQLDLVDRNEEN